MKTKKIVSMSILPELHDSLKRFAKRKGMSTSQYVEDLVKQALKLNPDDDIMMIGKPVDEDVTPVVLKIPSALRSDAEQLNRWLEEKTSGIVKALVKQDLPS